MIPAPFSWAVDLAAHLLHALWSTIAHISGNIAQLGPAWVAAYWLSVVVMWNVGVWGAASMQQIRRGSDFFEFDPARRGGSWVGRPAAALLRLQVASEAWVATGATAAGFGGVALLLAVGLVWQWSLAVVGLWAVDQALEQRRRARRRM